MPNTRTELKQLIKKLVSEIIEEETELSEMNTTGNVDGYQTPYAFSGSDEKTHKKKIKSNAEVFDYTISKESNYNTIKINEGKSLYHMVRDHPDYSPTQKVGVLVREINRNINEISKIINLVSRYKSENKINSVKYWRTTQRYLGTIDEKIKIISQKMKDLR